MTVRARASAPLKRVASRAFYFVLVLGAVNLFADMTYEGGGSITGPYLSSLGASAAVISIVAGLGEFLGYCLRSVSGYIADKTGKYWLVTFLGYIVNMLSVPAMALAGSWQLAAAFSISERIGRATRKPTIESMLSYTTGDLGRGWVYGLNTALDEIGATLGPIFVAAILYCGGDFRSGFAWMLIPSVLALISLTVARVVFPLPSNLETGRRKAATRKGFGRAYWLYMLAGACFAAGLTNFELISYHLSEATDVRGFWIPLFLGISTGIGVPIGLLLGRSYDRWGLGVVLIAVAITSLFSPLVFFGKFWGVLFGMALWGVGYATQDTLLKAIIAGLLPENRRGLAFGLFYTGYGGGWLIGSVAAGVLYDWSRVAVVILSISAQILSLPLFIAAAKSDGEVLLKHS